MPWGNKGKRCNFTLRVAGNRCVSLSSLTRAARYGTMEMLWLRRNTSKYRIHYTTTFQDKNGGTRSSSSLLLNIKQMFPAESLHRYARYALSIPPRGKVKQTTLTWKHILGAERNPNSSNDFKTKLVLFICVCSTNIWGWVKIIGMAWGSQHYARFNILLSYAQQQSCRSSLPPKLSSSCLRDIPYFSIKMAVRIKKRNILYSYPIYIYIR